MRNIAINLRARSEERDLIDQAAFSLGKNRSDFMLEAAREKAQSVILDQTFFNLNQKAFKDFEQTLNEPAKKNVPLKRLLSRRPQWKR